MKILCRIPLCLASAAISAIAQSQDAAILPPPTTPQVVSNGANFNLWQWQTFEPAPNGRVATHNHQYSELASGLNYLDPSSGKWVPSQAVIVPYAQGSICQMGQYKVIFSSDLNTAGAIDEMTPDGKNLRSTVTGLMYYDPATGQSAQIATVQDSEGQLTGENQVLYTNAFAGIDADVLLEYRLDGLEQFIVLRTQLPAPESFGLNSATVELEAVTEFLNPPPASVWNIGTDASGLEADQAVVWGATSLGHGKAFNLNGQDVPAKVIKQYVNIDGEYYLLEKVRFQDIRSALTSLPLQASNGRGLPGVASKHVRLPKVPAAKIAGRPMRLAFKPLGKRGYALDYTSLNSAYTNYTFQSGTTYYVSGNLDLEGTNYFEGGAVIKYSTNASVTGVPGSLMAFLSEQFRPVLFTSMDDNTIGETISGSTGSPVTPNSCYYLYIDSATIPPINYCRFCHAQHAIESYALDAITVRDCQFVDCAYPVDDWNQTDVVFQNVLFAGCQTASAFEGAPGSLRAENITADVINLVDTNNGQAASINLTNSIVFNSSAALWSANVSTNCTAINPAGVVFQTAGAGGYYLVASSPYHNAGTTNISAATLADLAVRTTYPPVIYSNTTLSVTTALNPVAQRDYIGQPDIGYHYDPLDICFGGVSASSNATFTAGTCVGWFELPGTGGAGYGLELNDGMSAVFTGTATAPCNFARYSMVQEGGDGLWKDKGWWGGIVNGGSFNAASPAILNARFTHFSAPAGDSNLFRDGQSGQPLAVQATDCEFLNGAGGYDMEMGCTNCLFLRASLGDSTSQSFPFQVYRNCTFYGGLLTFSHSGTPGANYWYSCLLDCSFDNTSFSIDDPYGVNTNDAYYNHNAFVTNAPQPPAEGAATITVTNFFWQASWFGYYYLPPNSPLIQQGSTTANLIGLYHFTTQTNQAPETDSMVTIGYHYVATDAHGNPLDGNGDGIPDYIEDANGNGLVDSGEIGWNIPGDLGLQVIISEPGNGSTLP